MENAPAVTPEAEQITAEPRNINHMEQVWLPAVVEHIKQEQDTVEIFLNEKVACCVNGIADIKQEIKPELEDIADTHLCSESANYSIKDDVRNFSVINDVKYVCKDSVDENNPEEISCDEKCNGDSKEMMNRILPTEYISVKEELKDTDDDSEKEVIDENYK